jgi:hypothetical protein
VFGTTLPPAFAHSPPPMQTPFAASHVGAFQGEPPAPPAPPADDVVVVPPAPPTPPAPPCDAPPCDAPPCELPPALPPPAPPCDVPPFSPPPPEPVVVVVEAVVVAPLVMEDDELEEHADAAQARTTKPIVSEGRVRMRRACGRAPGAASELSWLTPRT